MVVESCARYSGMCMMDDDRDGSIGTGFGGDAGAVWEKKNKRPSTE